MEYIYKKAGIAGKFRLIHKAHIELIVQAANICNNLCIFIVNNNLKRYCSIKELVKYFKQIEKKLDICNFSIYILNKDYKDINWDKKILSLEKDIEVMIDSKELYGNILINNLYLKLNSSEKISVTNIEKNLYDIKNFSLIDDNFKKFLTKIIIVRYKKGDDLEKIINSLKIFYNIKVIFKNNYKNILYDLEYLKVNSTRFGVICIEEKKFNYFKYKLQNEYIIFFRKDINYFINKINNFLKINI